MSASQKKRSGGRIDSDATNSSRLPQVLSDSTYYSSTGVERTTRSRRIQLLMKFRSFLFGSRWKDVEVVFEDSEMTFYRTKKKSSKKIVGIENLKRCKVDFYQRNDDDNRGTTTKSKKKREPKYYCTIRKLVGTREELLKKPIKIGSDSLALFVDLRLRIKMATVSNIDYLSSKSLSYEAEDEIGRGSFGVVFKGAFHGSPVAIKEIVAVRTSGVRSMIDELRCLVRLHHPNIVNFIGVCTEGQKGGGTISLVMEFYPLSLETLLYHREHVDKWNCQLFFNLVHDLAAGLDYLHSASVLMCHRDLKPENCFISESLRLCLGDFGVSKPVDPTGKLRVTEKESGTPAYLSPEVFVDGTYSAKSDVFAFAVCLWEMWSRQKPYIKMRSRFTMLRHIAAGKRLPMKSRDASERDSGEDEKDSDAVPSSPFAKSTACRTWPVRLKRIIERCWHPSADARPTMAEILQVWEEAGKTKFILRDLVRAGPWWRNHAVRGVLTVVNKADRVPSKIDDDTPTSPANGVVATKVDSGTATSSTCSVPPSLPSKQSDDADSRHHNQSPRRLSNAPSGYWGLAPVLPANHRLWVKQTKDVFMNMPIFEVAAASDSKTESFPNKMSQFRAVDVEPSGYFRIESKSAMFGPTRFTFNVAWAKGENSPIALWHDKHENSMFRIVDFRERDASFRLQPRHMMGRDCRVAVRSADGKLFLANARNEDDSSRFRWIRLRESSRRSAKMTCRKAESPTNRNHAEERVAILVSGAETSEGPWPNDLWYALGRQNGRVSWVRKGNPRDKIAWDGEKWSLKNMASRALYVSYENSVIPPVKGWKASEGIGSVKTISVPRFHHIPL